MLVVIGQGKDVLGWVLLQDLDDFITFTEITETAARGLEPRIPPHTMLNFQRRAAHPPALVRESQRRGWRIAGRHAYPRLVVASEGGEPTALTDEHYHTAETLCLALSAVSAAQASAEARWSAEHPFNVRVELPTSAGAVNMQLTSAFDMPVGGAVAPDFPDTPTAGAAGSTRSVSISNSLSHGATTQRSKNQQKAARRARRQKRER